MLSFIKYLSARFKRSNFVSMRKVALMLYTVFLSFLFIGQTATTISTLHLLTNTEQVIDSSNHFGDNCEEDHFTKTNNFSIFIPFKNYFSSSISINTIMGIPPFLWQPPR